MSTNAKVGIVVRFVLVTLVAVLSPFVRLSFCQDDTRPPYKVANLPNLEHADSIDFADALSEEIRNLIAVGSEAAAKDYWECCQPKPQYCVVIIVKLEIQSDQRKVVSIKVFEHSPKEQAEGKLPTNLTCSSSSTVKDCYRSLRGRMAKAVQEYDKQCHSKNKCPVRDGTFIMN